MADIQTQHDPGNRSKSAIAAAFTSLTAGGTGDNTAVTGTTIDRNTLGVGNVATFHILYEAVLAQAATLTLKTIAFEHSDDASTWVAYTSGYGNPGDPGVVATGGTGGSTERGVANLPIYVGSAKRYIRLKHTPDLSAANTDTAKTAVFASLSGFDRLPPA